MKISIYIILMVGLVSQYQVAFSQWVCTTPDTSANMIYNLELSKMSIFQPRSFDDVTLRVYYHVIRDSEGGGLYFSEAHVQESFNILQNDFNDYGIYFAWDCEINYIDNNWFRVSNPNLQTYKDSLFNQASNADGIDIFLLRTSTFGGGGYANGVGSESQFFVYGTLSSQTLGLTSVVSHEMGHVLYLWHTHRGCETGNWEFTENYHLDTVNCEVAGDFLCDTPADPLIWGNVNSSCEWNGQPHAGCEPFEPIGNYNPDPTNIMSYTRPNCMISFSDQQVQRMHNSIETLAFLQQCVVNEPFVYENYNCISSPEFSAISCLELIDDLENLLLNYIPTGFELIFGNEKDPNSPTFSEVDPIIAGSGTYYGFFYNPSTDFYGPPSDPLIFIECCGFDDIILTESVVSNDCPELLIDLDSYYNGTPPVGAILIWSTSSDPESDPFPIIDPLLSHEHNTTYYAFYYNEEADCYSDPSTGIEITIQSCCNVTDNVYISGNVNYEVPMSIGGNIVVQDQGTLTITSFLEIGGEKGIIVEDGGKLIIEGPNAVLTVCSPGSNHWDGIVIESGGELQTRGGKILNVKNGIYAENTWTFQTTPFPIIDIQGIEIKGKSFPYSRGITLWGVPAQSLSGIVVDEGFTYGLYLLGGGDIQVITDSEFKNLSFAGVYSAYNNFMISNCSFHNTVQGIYSLENFMGTINDNIFSDLRTGISSWNSQNLIVQSNQMYLNSTPESRGIFLLNSPGTNIAGNGPIEADRYGILAINSPGTEIMENDIQIEDLSSQGPNSIASAIFLVNSSESVVKDNSIKIEKAISGIESNNSNGVHIAGNAIYNSDYQNFGYRAINVVGSMNTTIDFNALRGPFGYGSGIFLQNSAGNTLDCNQAEYFLDGLHINHNSQYQQILGNTLFNGVDLTIRSEIGLQPFHGNLFKGGVARAFGLNTDQIRDSRFFVNSDYDYHIPVNVNSGSTQQWFFDDTDELDYFECPDGTNIPEEWTPFSQDSFDLCQYYQHLKTLDTIKPNKFFLGVFDLWYLSEIRQDFSLPGCILSDPDFQNLCGLQELVDVIIDLEQYGQHELATDSLISYQHQWLETTDSIQRTQLDSL
ncbi:MAG: hypothetical protein EA409_04690, partial [Saprospirales bacterium]